MNLKTFLTVDYESSLHIDIEQVVHLIVEIPSNDILGCAPTIILLFFPLPTVGGVTHQKLFYIS
jgi:hypothetical protein